MTPSDSPHAQNEEMLAKHYKELDNHEREIIEKVEKIWREYDKDLSGFLEMDECRKFFDEAL